MTDVSGIPNMGFGGGGYFGGNAATGQPAMSAAQINASMGLPQAQAAQSQALANLYGGGSFGAQPAYYAALGAAYGRQVPSSSTAAAIVQRARDYNNSRLSGAGASPYNPYGGGANPGGFSPSPNYPGGAYNPFAQYQSGGYNPFSASTYAPAVTRAPQTSGMPNLGYNPGMANYFANPGMNANPFQNRFGMGFPNAGTPSQYAPGANMPSSFSPLYSVDQPGGALPLHGPFGMNPNPGS